MTQYRNVLDRKVPGPEFEPQDPRKKLGVVAHTCNPSTGEAEADSHTLTANKFLLIQGGEVFEMFYSVH